MIKINRKNKTGASLIFALGVISFVSIISLSAYRMTEEQALMTADSNLRNETYQAAEGAIQEILDEYNLSNSAGLETLSKITTIPIVKCIRKNSTIELNAGLESCADNIAYNQNEIISQATTARMDMLCLTWGESDKNIKCYQVTGKGQIVSSNISTENVQEIQVVEIKQEDNGLYEF
jgi:Tfp pilus assembly protein PilX